MCVFLISIMLFDDYKSSKMGITKICFHMVVFYDYKFSKILYIYIYIYIYIYV